MSSRGIVKPLRDFDIRPGKRGPGAIELIGRYNYLNIGSNIFTAGLADPALWTNQLFTTDAGVNWYWTQYLKVYLGWQHAGFGNPVSYRAGEVSDIKRPVLAAVPDLLLSRVERWRRAE